MAGPCASVFVACAVDALEAVRHRFLSQVSNSQQDNDFWVSDTTAIGGSHKGEGRPFCWRQSERQEWEDEPNEYEQRQIGNLLGAPPRSQLSFCAMCNDDCDHRVLGELCISMARELNGIVRFDGLLTTCQTVEEVRLWRELSAEEHCKRFMAEVGNGGGRLTAFGLDPEDSPSCHYGDARFLKHWLGHPKFRMVK